MEGMHHMPHTCHCLHTAGVVTYLAAQVCAQVCAQVGLTVWPVYESTLARQKLILTNAAYDQSNQVASPKAETYAGQLKELPHDDGLQQNLKWLTHSNVLQVYIIKVHLGRLQVWGSLVSVFVQSWRFNSMANVMQQDYDSYWRERGAQ